MTATPTLAARGITHGFNRVPVLHDVTVTVAAGECVGILGENGAGKSTLLNILSGTLAPSAGVVELDRHPLALRSYHDANRHGVWRVFQEPAQIAGLPVWENLFLGHDRHFSRGGVLDTAAMRRAAGKLVADVGLAVDVGAPIGGYDFATRQALEVGRATLLPPILGLPAGFVLFDEPTTGLTGAEVGRLLERMRALRARGAGLAFVSHRLGEVLAVCDRILVLRDGALVGDGAAASFNENTLHRLMVGRDAAAAPARRSPPQPVAADGAGLVVQHLTARTRRRSADRSSRPAISGVSLRTPPGSITGVAGLLGSGKGELLRLLAGLAPVESGTASLGNRALAGSIGRRKAAGLVYVSADRLGEAVIGEESVARNISLPSGGDPGPRGFSNRLGVWRVAAERRAASAAIAAFGIKGRPATRVRELSGGNQQKVALARWLHREPALLLIENPTAGVDVGAKREIHALLRALAAKGASVLAVSDDLPELIELADRIVVMRDGVVAAEFNNTGRDTAEHDLIAAMIGVAAAVAVAA